MPLTVSLTSDKQSYAPNEFVNLHFSTNYYIPTATNAELLTIEILDDEGHIAKLTDDVEIKVSQANIYQQYSVYDILKHNPFGTYHAKTTCYNVVDTSTFQLINPDSKKPIFLGIDKSLYVPGDTVEVNIVVQEIIVDSGNDRIQKFAPISDKAGLIIPDWIRNNAKWWHEQQITDSDFAQGIEYMIKQKIIQIPSMSNSGSTSEKVIPDWMKNNAGWWADGLITDQEFTNGIEFLVNLGIIRV